MLSIRRTWSRSWSKLTRGPHGEQSSPWGISADTESRCRSGVGVGVFLASSVSRVGQIHLSPDPRCRPLTVWPIDFHAFEPCGILSSARPFQTPRMGKSSSERTVLEAIWSEHCGVCGVVSVSRLASGCCRLWITTTHQPAHHHLSFKSQRPPVPPSEAGSLTHPAQSSRSHGTAKRAHPLSMGTSC